MTQRPAPDGTAVSTVMVATDRSPTGDTAARWAGAFAERYGARLLLVQVVVPGDVSGTEAGAAEATRTDLAARDLDEFASELAGPRGVAKVVVDEDPTRGLLHTAEEAGVDTIIIGNAGMAGRKEFLLGNVPNRISHNAPCTVIIVNTAVEGGLRGRAGQPLAYTSRIVGGDPEPVEPHLMGRAARITRVMAKHGLKELFGKKASDQEEARRAQARRLRTALEELGPTFAKLGQILSTRPDLLPPAFIDELSTLQDNVPPLSEEEVVAVAEQELGVPWEDVFESIDPEPMAAGTIAQVHRATLTGGRRVVVKIQRPTAREEIMQDLALLELFAEKTEKRPALRRVVDMPAVFAHLSESLQRELDFRGEAANIERMRTVLEPYPLLDVPAVDHDISTSRLLVMEEVQGVPVREADDGPRREAARQLLESYYRQIMTEGFFHADPHPGNLMWWNGKIYLLDFGMVGELGPELREQLMLLLLAFWQEDVTFLTDVTLMLAQGSERAELDVDKFRAELGSLMARYRNVPLKEIQLGPILQEMTQISIRHDIPLPAALTLTAKAMAQMQLATAELDPDLDPFDVAGSFLMREMTGRLKEKADPRRLFYQGQKMRVRLTRLIEAVERLVGARPGPKLDVNFGAARLEAAVRRAGYRLALGVVAGAALLGAAVAATADSVTAWIPVPLVVLGGVLVAGLLVDLLRHHD